MKNLLTLLLIITSFEAVSQDTFSIVAVDSITGEVGSAGASCVPISLPSAPHGALIICDVLPGIGAINTQASWLSANQIIAHGRMVAGDSAQGVVDWMVLNDAQNNSTVRQYGVVELNGGHPRSAGFTGSNCMNYKNHVTGPGYSIQGNILLGQQILDSMEARYLNTAGSLSDRLMAALQGANVIGADTRCAPNGLSSLSSFIRVASPGDTTGTYSLDLYMAYPNASNWAVDPIDSIQTLYNGFINGIKEAKINNSIQVQIIQNENEFIFKLINFGNFKCLKVELFDFQGRKLIVKWINSEMTVISRNEIRYKSGPVLYRISDEMNILSAGGIGNR